MFTAFLAGKLSVSTTKSERKVNFLTCRRSYTLAGFLSALTFASLAIYYAELNGILCIQYYVEL